MKRFILLIGLVIWGGIWTGDVQGQEMKKGMLPSNADLDLPAELIPLSLPSNADLDLPAELIPLPQHIEVKNFEMELDDTWVIVVDTSDSQYNFSAAWLKDKVFGSSSINLTITDGNTEYPGTKRIILGNPAQHDFTNDILQTRNLDIPPYIKKEGYILEVFNDPIQEIIIAANAPNGIFYGVQTLLQLIGGGSTIQGISIKDYPDFEYRVAYASSRMNPAGYIHHMTDIQKEVIDGLSRLKINTILYQISPFLRDTYFWIDGWRDLMDYCSKRFIEIIPSVVSLKYNSGPFYLKEGWWVKDERFTFENDIAIPDIPFANLLYNGDFEIDGDENGIPDGWTIYNNEQARWTRDNTTSINGSYSMRLEAPDMLGSGSMSSAYVTLATQIDGAKPDSIYLITAWIKSLDIGGCQPQITFYSRCNDNSAYTIQSIFGDYGTSTWRKVGVCIKTGSNTSHLGPIYIYSRIAEPGHGRFWIDNLKVWCLNGSLKNVIRTEGTDIEITNLDKTITYTNGIDYGIVDGETADIFDEELQSCQIHRIPSGTIKSTETVLVSYDSVFYWNRDHNYNQPNCVSEPRLYTERYYPALSNITTYLNPKIINLQSDEIRGFNRDSRNVKRNMSNAELIAEWLNKVEGYVKSLDPDCRVVMWNDMLSPYHNGGIENYQIYYGGARGRMAEAVENDMIGNDAIMNIWWYSDDWLAQMEAATRFFREKGFDYFVAPYRNLENTRSWSEFVVGKPGALGAVCVSWRGDESGFPIMADHFWNTRYKVVYFDSFEKDEDNNSFPDGWYYTGQTPSYSTDGSHVQGGKCADFPNCAVRIIGNSSMYSNFIPVTPNKSYRFSAYIKRQAPGNENPRLKITWYNSDKDEICMNAKEIDVTCSYDCYEIEATSPQAASYLRLYLKGQEQGIESFWFDTIRLLTTHTSHEENLSPNIILHKQADKKVILSGQQITYTITYTNEGSGTATDVNIIDVLPENVKLSIVHSPQSIGKSIVYSPQSIVNYWVIDHWQTGLSQEATKIKWVIPEVAPAESGTVSFTVEVR